MSHTDEWIKKCGMYTKEFYSTIKNKIILFVGKWMELENIMLSKASLKKSKVTCFPSYVEARPMR
jgi:hypothetical protein